VVGDPQPTSAPALPSSRLEAKSVAACFTQPVMLIGELASKATVLASLPGSHLCHFACHARVDPVAPWRSSLLLAGNEELRLDELEAVDSSQLRLVVLSACESTVPSYELVTEFVSLSTAFLKMGTRATIASKWAVGDLDSLLFMYRFYRIAAADGINLAEAISATWSWVRDTSNAEKRDYFDSLRFDQADTVGIAAQQLYRYFALQPPGERSHAHPFHWAAFELAGSST
jgi:CHAT domain-containing protein